MYAAVAWTSLSHCSYHEQSERHIVAVSSSWPQKEVAIWDRWSNSLHTVGLYSVQKEGALFNLPGLHPMWSPDGCSLAFDSTHTGQGWQVRLLACTCFAVHEPMCLCIPLSELLGFPATPGQTGQQLDLTGRTWVCLWVRQVAWVSSTSHCVLAS